MANFQVWMADNTWGNPDVNHTIFPEVLEDGQIHHRKPDLIFKYQPPPIQRRGGQRVRPHQIEIWEISIVMNNTIAQAKIQKEERYRELREEIKTRYPESEVNFRPMVFGVMGIQNEKMVQNFHFESLVQEIHDVIIA